MNSATSKPELNPLVFPHLGKNKKPLSTKENLTELLKSGGFSIVQNQTEKAKLDVFLNGQNIGSFTGLSKIAKPDKTLNFYLHLKSFCVQNGLPITALDYLPLIVADFMRGEK